MMQPGSDTAVPSITARIHRRPDAASTHVGHLKASAQRVRTMGCERLAADGWCRVMGRGTDGWVQDRFLPADNVMRGRGEEAGP